MRASFSAALAIGFALAASGCGQEPATGSALAERVRDHVAFLADDSRGGRETGSPGFDEAALYVARQFEAAGLSAAARDGGYFQRVPLRSSRLVEGSARMAIDGRELTHLVDFVASPSMVSENSAVRAPAVFVGYGVHAPAFGIENHAGLDLSGKIAVAFSGAPSSLPSEERAHFGSSRVKMREAANRGAIGFVSLYTAATEERSPWDRAIRRARSTRMAWTAADGAPFVAAPEIQQTALMSPEGGALLFARAARDYDDVRAEADAVGGNPSGFRLGITLTLEARHEHESLTSSNVVGLWHGSAPDLQDEHVVLCAHLDHLGPAEKDQPDRIRNGALDNAMGVATMIEAAHLLTMADPPVRRSVLFVATTGEEKGLTGSDYFARHPPVPLESIVANVNLDMPLTLYPFTDVVAFGAEHSTLQDPVARAAAAEGIELSEDPMPDQGLFTRSDHYRFVQQGVPSVFLFLGFENGGRKVFDDFMERHYHRASDDMNLPIDFEAAARFARINARIAEEIANAEDRPRWNEGDFFGDLYSRD